ncbi:MAG: Mbeg1-like protein [Christensenellales bacterium]
MKRPARAFRRSITSTGRASTRATISSEAFGKVDMRIRTFVPQSSMIGILMWHREPFTIVRSNGVGVFQHDAYTWQIWAADS